MAKIAILGFGTVGSGVYEVLCRNAAGVSRRAGEPVEVKYILDPKDFSGNPVEPLVVKNIDVILQDPEIRVVVETIGGTRFAYPYVKACLESGRSVCTSNKEMVATYGAELLWRRHITVPSCSRPPWAAAPPSSPPCISVWQPTSSPRCRAS